MKGSRIVGYGAPGKGNTLLNYCGIRTDFLDYTVDRSPYKQGKFLPGTHIPIFHPDRIKETKPDYVLILPWNLKDRDHGADGVHPRMGRAVRGAYSGGGGLRLTPSLHRRPRRLASSRLYDVVLDLGRDSPICLLWASSGTLDTSTRIPNGSWK